MPHDPRNHQQQHKKSVALLGTSTLVEDALSLLLESAGAGYDVRRLGTDQVGLLANGLLEGADLLLLGPGLGEGKREVTLAAVKANPATAPLPVLTISSATGGEAGCDEERQVVAWPSPIEELARCIEAALSTAAEQQTGLKTA